MGSFDVACGLSNLSIREGDRTGLILLNKVKPYSGGWDKRERGTALTIYHNTFYRPFFTPIYGTYNDYGSIDNIEENISTQILEEIFALPIATIVEIVTVEGRDIYDSHNPICKAYGLVDDVFGYTKSEHESFVALGFTPIIKDSLYEYEGYMLSKEANKSWVVMKESVIVTNKMPHYFSEMFEAFGDIVGNYPGYPKEHTNRIKEIRKLNGMFFHARVWDELKTVELDDWSLSGAVSFAEEWADYIRDLKKSEKKRRSLFPPRSDYVERNQSVDHAYHSYYLKYENSKEMLDMVDLDAMMRRINRMYAPSSMLDSMMMKDF